MAPRKPRVKRVDESHRGSTLLADKSIPPHRQQNLKKAPEAGAEDGTLLARAAQYTSRGMCCLRGLIFEFLRPNKLNFTTALT